MTGWVWIKTWGGRQWVVADIRSNHNGYGYWADCGVLGKRRVNESRFISFGAERPLGPPPPRANQTKRAPKPITAKQKAKYWLDRADGKGEVFSDPRYAADGQEALFAPETCTEREIEPETPVRVVRDRYAPLFDGYKPLQKELL